MRIAIINRFTEDDCDYSDLKDVSDTEYIFFNISCSNRTTKNFYNFNYSDSELNLCITDIIEMHKKIPFSNVLTPYEFDVELGGAIREYLDIGFQSRESCLSFRDKLIMKNKLREVVNLPRYSEVSNLIDIIEFIESYGFPVIIKPRNSAGSFGVKLLNNYESLKKLEIINLENYLIESYVKGSMFHLDGLYCNGEILFCSVSKYLSDCLTHEKEEGEYVGSVMVDLESDVAKILTEELKKVLNTLSNKNERIPYHCEFFITENGDPIFCEIASRIGGGLINQAVENSYKFDLFITSLINEHDIVENEMGAYSGWILFPSKSGKLLNLELADFEWIKFAQFDKSRIGRILEKSHTSIYSIVGYVVQGNSSDEVLQRIEKLIEWQEKRIQWG